MGLVVDHAAPMSVPGGLYTIQNVLLFYAAGMLPAFIFQVSQGSKILFTAIFTSTILGRELKSYQWIAQPLLAIGMVLLSIKPDSGGTGGGKLHAGDNILLGLILMTIGNMISSFTGIYIEKFLKSNNDPGIWVRNAQLSIFGTCFGAFYALVFSRAQDQPDGMWQGFEYPVVWALVILQALSGFAVAFVMKYADNILKNFGSAASTILTGFVSYALYGEVPSIIAGFGAMMVMFSVITYGGTWNLILDGAGQK